MRPPPRNNDSVGVLRGPATWKDGAALGIAG